MCDPALQKGKGARGRELTLHKHASASIPTALLSALANKPRPKVLALYSDTTGETLTGHRVISLR